MRYFQDLKNISKSTIKLKKGTMVYPGSKVCPHGQDPEEIHDYVEKGILLPSETDVPAEPVHRVLIKEEVTEDHNLTSEALEIFEAFEIEED